MFLSQKDLKLYILKEVLILFAVTLSLIAFYSYYQSKRALSQFSRDYVSKYTESLVDTIETRMDEPSEALNLVSLWFPKISHLDDIDSNQLIYLKNLLKIFDSLASFYIGLENGSFIHFHIISEYEMFLDNQDHKIPLNAEYCITKINQREDIIFEANEYYNKDDYLISHEVSQRSVYDARNTEWYKEVKSKGKPYINPTIKLNPFSQELVFTIARPIIDFKDTFQGVVAADLDIKKFSRFLKEKLISSGTAMFILDENDQVFANSTFDLAYYKTSHSDDRLTNLRELKESIFWSAVKEFQVKKKDQFELKSNNKHYVVNVTDFSDSSFEIFGKKWKLVTMVPFEEIFSVFLQSQQDNFGVYIFAIILVFLRIIMISRKLSEPIEELNEEALKIKNFDFNSTVKIDSKIKEVSTLSQTIQTMRTSLRSFTKYIPRNLVMKLLEKNQDISLGGESKKLAILFSDVEGFTTVSESMDPQALMTHISDYFEQLTQIILNQQGTIDKYIGDSIMAFWGAPDEDSQRSFNACRAALLCQHALMGLNKNWASQNKPILRTRMGIHTGEVVVGNMGSSERMNYTIIGDAVNLSSRLEGINKVYGTSIIISEFIYEEIKDNFVCCVLDIVAVKGKSKGVKIYELLAQKNAEDFLSPTPFQEEFTISFNKAYEFYLKMNWEKAIIEFKKLLDQLPQYNNLIQMYLERCRNYLEKPPSDDWEGVHHLTSK